MDSPLLLSHYLSIDSTIKRLRKENARLKVQMDSGLHNRDFRGGIGRRFRETLLLQFRGQLDAKALAVGV